MLCFRFTRNLETVMQTKEFYPIGVAGQKWQDTERQQWRDNTSIKRSYHEEVVSKILALKHRFQVEQYGAYLMILNAILYSVSKATTGIPTNQLYW